jgi:glutathione-regulated potassium-efflux system ancillary protein KefG
VPKVDTEDLIDARGVAELLGLAHPNSVSTYQRRYDDMPKPALDLGAGRPRLWLRSQIVVWIDQTHRGGGNAR